MIGNWLTPAWVRWQNDWQLAHTRMGYVQGHATWAGDRLCVVQFALWSRQAQSNSYICVLHATVHTHIEWPVWLREGLAVEGCEEWLRFGAMYSAFDWPNSTRSNAIEPRLTCLYLECSKCAVRPKACCM